MSLSSYQNIKKQFFPVFYPKPPLSRADPYGGKAMQSESDFARSRQHLYAQIRSKLPDDLRDDLDHSIDPLYRVNLDYNAGKRVFTLPEIAFLLHDQLMCPYFALSWLQFKITEKDIREFILITTSPMYGLKTNPAFKDGNTVLAAGENGSLELLAAFAAFDQTSSNDFGSKERLINSFKVFSFFNLRRLIFFTSNDDKIIQSWRDYFLSLEGSYDYPTFLDIILIKISFRDFTYRQNDSVRRRRVSFLFDENYQEHMGNADFLLGHYRRLLKQYGYTHKFLTDF